MASNLLLNDELQRWLELHNVSLDPVFPDSGGSYLWPQQVSDAADLLKHSAEHAVGTIKGLVSTLENPEDELLDDPAPSVLSACAAFPELSKSESRLPLREREILLWTIVKGVVPGTRIFYQASFALPRCDTGDEEVDQRGVPLYGSSTLLCMKEYGPSESVDCDDDSVDFIWRGGYDDLSDLESGSSNSGNCWRWRLPPDPGDETDDSEDEDDDDEVEEDEVEVEEDDSEDEEDDSEDEEDRHLPDDVLGQGGSISGQHLTPSTFHPSPLVPVLCVADEVNIVPLLSSALLQRRELEIMEPVVGILLPTSGSKCQVLFGWMEENTDDMHALPRIHIVYSDGSNPSVPGGGIFDLQHRSDLINLVTYIADLCNQQSFNVRSPLPLLPNANSFTVPWRADEHLGNSKDHDYSTQRIWIWLHSIPDPRATTSSEEALAPGLAPQSAGSEQVVQKDLDPQNSGSKKAKSKTSSKFAAKSYKSGKLNNIHIRLKIQEETSAGQKDASIADWLWDHRAFVIGYDDPRECVETIYSNADFKAYLEHTKGLARLVRMPCDAGIDLMMTKLAHNLLLMVQNLKLESKEEEEHKENTANPLSDQLNKLIDAVDKKLQEALGMSQTNQGLISESLMLANPHVAYTLNNCHKSVLAMYNKQNVSEAEWRLPWDTIHNLIWLQTWRLGRHCTQAARAEQPNYFVFPEATLRYMRCEELDYASMRVKAMLPALESESASPVAAIPKPRSHQENRLAPRPEETQNYLHARRRKPQFERIAKILALHKFEVKVRRFGATERAMSEFEEAAELSLEAVMAVKQLCEQAIASERPLGTQIKEPALLSQVENLKIRIGLYPKRGKCDAIFAISIPDFCKKVASVCGPSGIEAAQKFLAAFSSFRPPLNAVVTEESGSLSHLETKLTPLFPGTTTTIDFNNHLADPKLSEALFLPYYLVDYKLNGGQGKVAEAENQRRMNSASVAHFLRIIGITDFPVYGLTHAGPFHTLSMTWYSSTDDIIYICDRNAPGFDLRKSCDMLRYMSFLIRLEDHALELQRRYNKVQAAFLEKIRKEVVNKNDGADSESSLLWTASDQADKFKIYYPEKGAKGADGVEESKAQASASAAGTDFS
ncbi:hypothetical protein L227DRAFT_654949 [Lentinus tigrinus ALCF2SS1-6]|uniref:Uncharacterized protein n=1 Tax=Lentinus tigrinus ALCF2SS1-6 TaxID=1328759 RepID=A0A5C2S413_9APHY|nr:hypothetical protein L227DRAFT_654949 [Lentinus tigrinus ALCF2SS1-6]